MNNSTPRRPASRNREGNDTYQRGYRDGLNAGIATQAVRIGEAGAEAVLPAQLGAAFLAATRAPGLPELAPLEPLLIADFADFETGDALLRALEVGVHLGRYALDRARAPR